MQNRKLAVALGLLGATMLSTPACAQAAAGSTAPASAPTAAPSDQAVQAVTIETVVVTARRRAENLERVPVAVTAISPETIRDENIKSALDLQDLSPSLSVSGSLGSRDDNVFTIRGQSQPFGGADPGVQSYFNEVPFGGSGPGYYYDMDNIQVLRGPQGTLFGRNTTGGAVLFQPKKPSDQFGGYIDGQVGDFAMHEVQGALNVPVIGDKLMIRVAGDWNRRNGFTKDLSTGSDLDNVSYDAFRVGVTVKPFKGFENNFEFNYLNNHDHGTGAQLTGIASDATLQARYDAQVSALLYPSVYSGLVTTFMNPPYNLLLATAQTQASAQAPAIALAQAQLTIDGMYYTMLVPALSSQQALGPRKTTSTIPLFYKRHTMDLTDTAQYDILEHLRIRNIFGYLIDETQSAFDYDGNAMALLEIPNARTWEQNSRQITEEFQVTGETEDDMWNWIAGFYYENDYRGGYAEVERDVFGGGSNIANPLGSTEVDALSNGGHSIAAYGHLTFDASKWVNGLSFTGGARYTWDKKITTAISCVQYAATSDPACHYPVTAALYGSSVYTANFRAPTWDIGANWQASEDTLLYATWRRGYKSGGFNAGAAGVNPSTLMFKPEYLTDVEIGTKNNWEILGVPGRTNFDLYYGWYQNVQKNDIVGFGTTPRPPVVLTVNAAKATIKGLEFESTFIPDENFQVTAFYSFTEASYDSFLLPATLDYTGMTVTSVANHKGDPFAYTPKHKVGVTGRYHLPVDSSYGKPYLTATWYWQSKVWFTDVSDEEPDAHQGDYGLINLRLDWDGVLGSSFDVSAFVNNVTNRNYKVGANALEHEIGTNASIFGAPRMFGVELRYRFGADANP